MSSPVPVAPVGGPRDRGALILVVLFAVAVFIAIAKPWVGGPESAAIQRTPWASPSTPAPVPSPSPTPRLARVDKACQVEAGWRIFTVGTSGGHPVDTWYSVDPVRAIGATDPAIPVTHVFTESLAGLGYCAAGTARDAGGHISETIAWRISAGGIAVPVPLTPAPDPGLHDPDVGALFVPTRTVDEAPRATWDPASYVFAIGFDGGPNDTLWFGAEVIAVTTPSPEARSTMAPGDRG